MRAFRRQWGVAIILAFGCNEYEMIPDTDLYEPDVEECPLVAPTPYKPENSDNCSQEPEIGTFFPVVEWQWKDNPVNSNYFRVENPPMVANLTDDNGDGVIDTLDTPDVLVTAMSGSSYTSTGYVVALAGDTGEVLWSHGDYDGAKPWALSGPAIADVDADGLPDIFIPSNKGLLRLTHDGELVWLCEVPTVGGGQSIVTLADLEGDGRGEAIIHGAVCNHDGTIRWQAIDNTSSRYYGSIAIDLDVDGYQEVIADGTVFNYDGTTRWRHAYAKGIPAIGDLNNDNIPEIILGTANFDRGHLRVLDIDGNLVWDHEFDETGAGAPTVADFDGDGLAEIGIATKNYYYVFEGDGSILWQRATQESSSGFTGSAVFDFEGDGAAEVVYADEKSLWVYDGITSEVELEFTEHSSGTRFEYPTIADVDGDGSAEILVGHGRGGVTGLTVLGSVDSSWAPSRPIWNQYAYSISNINDDGSLPMFPYPNWWKYNNFRAGNAQSNVGLELPDLALGEPNLCLTECARKQVFLSIPVENRGQQSISGDITVRVYAAYETDETLLYEEILEGMGDSSTRWIGPIEIQESEYGTLGLKIVLDEEVAGETGITECIEDNNIRQLAPNPCPDSSEASE